MRPITNFIKDGAWKGRRAFVVGSGPSLQGFDFGALSGELTVGCNMEYRRHRHTISLIQDKRVLEGDGAPKFLPLRSDPAWFAATPTLPVYLHAHPDLPIPEGVPDTVALVHSDHSREHPFRWGTSLATGLYYGANCGMAAINLAEILGADPIFLLGFDANRGDPRTHHHKDYPKEWLAGPESLAVVYERWRSEFRSIAKKCKASVYNLNPQSGIDAFPTALLGVGQSRIVLKGVK